jgi:hypothetical protein
MLMLLPLLQGGKAQILPLKRYTVLPLAGTVQCENRPENGNNDRAIPTQPRNFLLRWHKSRQSQLTPQTRD